MAEERPVYIEIGIILRTAQTCQEIQEKAQRTAEICSQLMADIANVYNAQPVHTCCVSRDFDIMDALRCAESEPDSAERKPSWQL